MNEKIEELREEYSRALREGDTDRATDVYWQIQDLKDEENEDLDESQNETASDTQRFEQIDGVGPELAEELLQEYGSYPGFVENADMENLSDISGIGDGKAESILEQVGN